MSKYSLSGIVDALKKELTPIKGLSYFPEEQLKFLLAKCVTYGKSNGTLAVPHFQMNAVWDEVCVSYNGQVYAFKTDRHLINLGFTPNATDYLGIVFESYSIDAGLCEAQSLKQIMDFIKGKSFTYSEDDVLQSLAELAEKPYSGLAGSVEFKLLALPIPIVEIKIYAGWVETIPVVLTRYALNEIILLNKELADQ